MTHHVFPGNGIPRLTGAYRVLAGLDLAYGLLAHIERDHQIIGMLTEVEDGKPLARGFRDRCKVL
jgi:hypothetical protein